jgi:Putative ER transporter, 6TM, N-terminal
VNDLNLREQKETRETEEHRKSRGNETPRTVNRYQVIRQKVKQREIQQGHDLDTLVPLLASASANLRSTSEDALTCIIDWLQDCSSHRWSALFLRTHKEQIADRQRKLKQELRKIEDALENFRTVERVKLIKPYEKSFDTKTKKLLKHDDIFTSRFAHVFGLVTP